MDASRINLSLSTETEREDISRLRHRVYAHELGQHPVNHEQRLQDRCDETNVYLVARVAGKIAGFISITLPGGPGYSLDKYLTREEMPFPVDDGTYEVRLLTVVSERRGRSLAVLLMYAAFRYVEAHGGARIIAMGRRDIRAFYAKAGMELTGRLIPSGSVVYELMGASLVKLARSLARFGPLLARLRRRTDWRLDFPFYSEARCTHGGGFFGALGDGFETLERRLDVVNADVLDTWFPPAPGVLRALEEHLPWLLQTSPPVGAEGLVRTLAEVRGLDPASLVVGPGSSSLIYLAFLCWLGPTSRVLLPDPTYGEYGHLLERVIGCRVNRFPLHRHDNYRLNLDRLEARLKTVRYDACVLVNPNNPTGSVLPRERLEAMLQRLPSSTRIWVDEAYIDYLSPNESVERFAARSTHVVVCKSLSKSLALSGARAAYLCGPPSLMSGIRALLPPWATSLPAQVAAVAALRDPDYYTRRYTETHVLRERLGQTLMEQMPGVDIPPAPANWLLCHLPPDGPDAATVCDRCCTEGVYLRDAGAISTRLGRHALRIAVKDATANTKTAAALCRALAL